MQKTRTEKKADLVELEKKFLSSILSNIDTPQFAAVIARYAEVSWRQFIDKKHQALWRALQTLDLAKSEDERVEILLKERGLAREALVDNLGLVKKLSQAAAGCAWLEHELAAAGALSVVGGKMYVRKICPKHQMMDSFMDEFAQRLGFGK